jgi:hypothetical protein
MERETNEITLPSGRKIVAKTYITAREALPAIGDDTKSAADKSNDLAAIVVVSIDGQTENVKDLILDLPLSDYAFLLAKVKDISDGNFQPTN